MDNVLPDGYGQKEYEMDLYAYTVATRRNIDGDDIIISTTKPRIDQYEKVKKEMEEKRSRELLEYTRRKNEIKQRAISEMSAGYNDDDYANDRKLTAELKERENELEDTEVDIYNLAFTRISLFEAQRAKELKNEKAIMDSKKAAKKAENERKKEAKIRRENALKELTSWDARERILLFLKLRKNKTVSDEHIQDFSHLLNNILYRNFKDFDSVTMSKSAYKDHEIRLKAIKCLRSDFIVLEAGGTYRKADISDFSLYKDEKYRATIAGVKTEITEGDFFLLTYVFR